MQPLADVASDCQPQSDSAPHVRPCRAQHRVRPALPRESSSPPRRSTDRQRSSVRPTTELPAALSPRATSSRRSEARRRSRRVSDVAGAAPGDGTSGATGSESEHSKAVQPDHRDRSRFSKNSACQTAREKAASSTHDGSAELFAAAIAAIVNVSTARRCPDVIVNRQSAIVNSLSLTIVSSLSDPVEMMAAGTPVTSSRRRT